MLLIEKEIHLPSIKQEVSLLKFFERAIKAQLFIGEVPVRFAVTKSDADGYHCELGVLTESKALPVGRQISIFDFGKRRIENTDKFNAVMIVPTGIGAELGGHAGDATPTARLLAGVCDKLITHPNVVNASDINEMPGLEEDVMTRQPAPPAPYSMFEAATSDSAWTNMPPTCGRRPDRYSGISFWGVIG